MATVDAIEEQVRSSVEQLARRAVNLYRLRALLVAVGLTLVATIGFVGLDYTLHVEERGWRWLLSLLWVLTLAGIVWRWAPDAFGFRLTAVQVAQWIERRRPELGDSLSRMLAVSDLPDADPRFGSIEFRREAGRLHDRVLAELPWYSFLDKRSTIRAGLFCVASLIAAGLAVVTVGPIASRGVARIALPWSWMPWPRAEQLQLLDAPDMIARERELEVRVVDGQPPLPELVELEVRDSLASSNIPMQKFPMRIVDAMAVVTLPTMENDFEIRPIGGDQQDGPWHTIRVTRQPQLKEYAFTVQPPAYVHQSTPELVGQRIDVLSGSRVTMRGRFDERLKSLRAVAVPDAKRPNDSAEGPAVARVWEAVLASDGHAFELFPPSDDSSLVVEDRRWQLELETAEGLQLLDGKQWTIHASTDRPPTVTLSPIEARGITRNATLNLLGSANDDLGLTHIELTWQVAGQPPQNKLLWSGQHEQQDADANEGKLETGKSMERSVDIWAPWSIAGLSIPTGQTLTIELTARDSAGQSGKSVPQTLQVLDEAAALAALQHQQAELFGPLRQLLDAQRRNQQALNRTLDISQELKAVNAEQAEAVSNAYQQGQNIGASLSRNPDSLARQMDRLSDQLHRNQLDDTPLANEVSRLRGQIDHLVKDQLEPALKELNDAQQAIRSAENPSDQAAALNKLSKAAQAHQQATDRFGELVDTVAVAESLAELQKQVQELANDQAALSDQTERLQIDHLVKGDSPQGDALRAGIQSDQQNLTRRVEEMASRLLKDRGNADDKSMDAASERQIENAHRKLLERGISDHMRQASERLRENRLGDALAAQQQAGQLLDEVAAELGGGATGGLESSSESMQDMAAQLNRLATNQQQLAESFQRTADSSPATRRQLGSQQQSLRDKLQELAAEPTVPANQQLQEMLDEASQSMDQALEKTEQNQLQDASQNAGAAAQQLKTAALSAKQRAEQLKSQVAEQQIFDLQAILTAAVKRQQPVVASLEATQHSERDNRPQVNGMGTAEMIATEQQLQQQLLQAQQRLRSLDAFQWLLAQCDEELLRTIAALERQRTPAEAYASAKAALEMMQAAESAVSAAANNNSASTDNSQAENPQSEESSPSQVPTLASLRLLRQMQTLINQQSEQLLSETNRDTADAAALERMADRQQALAEQVALIREQLQQQKR